MSYYECGENRWNQTVIELYCVKADYDDCLLECDVTPAQKSARWTMWKDMKIHDIMEQYFWPKGKFLKFRIFDKVFNTENSIALRPDRHNVFFCDCHVAEFLKNYIYEEPGNNYLPTEITTLDIDITGIDLYCHETM